MKRLDTLTARLLHNLIDGEEFLEELYLGVNFDLQEQRSPDSSRKSVFFYRAYEQMYRLTEILESLQALSARGWVTSRRVAGFPQHCGPTAMEFSLTDEGERACRTMVVPVADEYYL
jgi:hypothetical protein